MRMKSGNRIVIVTGATRGIGAAIAQEFWRQGAHVVITGTHQDEVDRLNQDNPERKLYVHVDFMNPSSLEAFRRYIASLERLDVCVNNAGINIIKHVDQVTEDDFDKVTIVNYRTPYLVAQTAAQVMRRQRCGWIVNLGSIWSVITKKGRSQYSAAKAGLAGMTRAIATDLAADGILVNCVSPGFVLTDLTRQSLTPQEIQALAQQVPLGRFADPVEIARLVAFLGSEQNTYLTGQNIVIDGGFTNV
jgi:3-oxoacyl-[acyl-carrier protein] reductase